MHHRLVQPERDSARYDSPALCPSCKDPSKRIVRRAAQYTCECGHKGLPAAFLAAASIAQLRTGRLETSQPALQPLTMHTEEVAKIRQALPKPAYAADYASIEARMLAHNAGEGEV